MRARYSLYGQRVKPTRIFIDGEEKEFLFQQDIGPFLRALDMLTATVKSTGCARPPSTKVRR
jgi:hypothetical protein